ncbi:MAG: DUF1109 domain-containing protein [Pseudomonadota bacterium]
MKTEELTVLLATGAGAVDSRVIERRIATALGWGVAFALILMVSLLGARADLLQALLLPKFWLKVVFAAALVAAGLMLLRRLARPGMPIGTAAWWATSPFIALWALALFVLSNATTGQRLGLVLGQTWMVCPWLIAMLSVPLLAGMLWALQAAAPPRPTLAGAGAGFLSGAVATLVYCIHCPEMEAPFVAVWYFIGIFVPTIVGAFLGSRLLRW